MIKYLKYILIVCPIILSILLGINIYKNIKLLKENNKIIENTNNFEKQIIDNNKKKEEQLNILSSLKESKKTQIEEYERWIKWKKAIEEKIN